MQAECNFIIPLLSHEMAEGLRISTVSQHAIEKHFKREEEREASYFFLSPVTVVKMLKKAVESGTYERQDGVYYQEVKTTTTVLTFDVGSIVGRVYAGCTSANPLGECYTHKIKGVYAEDGQNITLYPMRVLTDEERMILEN